MQKWETAKRMQNSPSRDIKIATLSAKGFFKQHVKAVRTFLDQVRDISLSEMQDMVTSEDESNLLNKDVNYFLTEIFGHSFKFSKSETRNK